MNFLLYAYCQHDYEPESNIYRSKTPIIAVGSQRFRYHLGSVVDAPSPLLKRQLETAVPAALSIRGVDKVEITIDPNSL